MRLLLIVITVIFLQACYLDDEQVKGIRDQVQASEPNVEIIKVSEFQSGVIKGVKSGDILRLSISGERQVPQFSEIYESSLDCSWKEILMVPRLVGYEEIIEIPMGGFKTVLGSCFVSVRDFLGFETLAYNFEDNIEELRLKVKGQEQTYELDQFEESDEHKVIFEILVVDEMITAESELQLIVDPQFGHFVKTGVVEILEDNFCKRDINIIDDNFKTKMISNAVKQRFEVQASKLE